MISTLWDRDLVEQTSNKSMVLFSPVNAFENGVNLLTCMSVVELKSSYTLSPEYRMVRNRYSRLLFTSEDLLCANLHVQEQWTNMTSLDLLWWRHNAQSENTILGDNDKMSDRWLFLAECCVHNIK